MFGLTAQPWQMLTRFGNGCLLHLFATRTALSNGSSCAPKGLQAQYCLKSGVAGGSPPLRRFAASAAAPFLGSTRLASSRQHLHRCRAEAVSSMEVQTHRPCAEAVQSASCTLLSTSGMHVCRIASISLGYWTTSSPNRNVSAVTCSWPPPQVTRHNFDEVLPAVRAALADCHFFALDCEMTGLHVRDQRFSFHTDMQDQYSTVTHWLQK